jgi:LuxR family maltose regulon positive regulatory protein
MAEANRIGAHGSANRSLLATKLHVPPVKPGFVARQRLTDQLNNRHDASVVLVCAPPGFGKTYLLADWTARREGAVAWLSLDAADNDPARFWRHLAAAIDRVSPGIADRLRPVTGPESLTLEPLITALINELDGVPPGPVLVLDDYHLIEAERVHRSVLFLVDHLPPAVRLVIATRSDPPFPLARLRANGQLLELRAADLRFTRDEGAGLLAAALGSALPDGVAWALTDRTEGWAAGLQLAALSLRERPDVQGFMASFSGSHRYVLDYLTEEVLDLQPATVRSFLLETSLLRRLSGDLCDAVTGRRDGQLMLEHLERSNLFLVALDETRRWWRYHQLFADLLRARLLVRDAGRVAAIHRAAAAWHDQHGSPDEAIHHARAAGDETWAARLIERHADSCLLLGEGATLRCWLADIPTDVAAGRPRLLLAEASLALVSGDDEAFEVPFVAAERALAAFPGAGEEPFEPSVGWGASLLGNLPAAMTLGSAHLAELHGDAKTTGTLAARAEELVRDGEWILQILVRAHVAVAAMLRGDLREAEDGFTSTLALCRSAGEQVLAVRSMELLGRVQRAAGRLEAALDTYRDALAILAPPDTMALPVAGYAHVAIAEVAYQRGDLALAMRHLEPGISLCRRLGEVISGSPQPLATGLATLAWVRQASGDPSGARAAMAEAVELGPGPAVTSLLNPVLAERARLQLAQGDTTAAQRWATERGLESCGVPEHSREPEYLVFARLLIAQQQPATALALLDRLAENATGRTGSRIEIQMLRALALAASGHHPEALDALADALGCARREGWARVFLDEGDPMAALLRRLAATAASSPGNTRAVDLGQVASLLRTLDETGGSGPRPRGIDGRAPIPGMVEQLSPRELEVLGLLAAGRPNREIAQELFVTVDTVKKHVTHVLGKLGAANRTQAAARARALGLLDGARPGGAVEFHQRTALPGDDRPVRHA